MNLPLQSGLGKSAGISKYEYETFLKKWVSNSEKGLHNKLWWRLELSREATIALNEFKSSSVDLSNSGLTSSNNSF